MRDPRYEKLAGVLVNYSVAVEKGDLVEIGGGAIAEPLLSEIYRETLRVGGHPFLRLSLPGLSETFFSTAKQHQLKFVNPISEFEVDRVDKVISIWGGENTKAMAGVDPKKLAIRSKATSGLFKRFMEREAAGELKWVGTQFPCNASAQDAEMSLEDYEDFVLKACMVHLKDPIAAWKKVHGKQKKICRQLDERKKIRVVAEGTDLTMNVEGRTWVNCDGLANMPDGEIFTGPIEDSVEGTVSFSFPAYYSGREADGVKLTFKKGRVVKASASKNEDFLHAMLDSDEGARRVGEFAIGTNYSIQKFTKNTLFDEKIGGTFHMALGASLPESGGKNESGVHWDIVNDMRNGGKIYADGKIIYKDGRFTI
ncbi:MAG: aminopeptidase [Candidatus Eisenbacteria bacterium]